MESFGHSLAPEVVSIGLRSGRRPGVAGWERQACRPVLYCTIGPGSLQGRRVARTATRCRHRPPASPVPRHSGGSAPCGNWERRNLATSPLLAFASSWGYWLLLRHVPPNFRSLAAVQAQMGDGSRSVTAGPECTRASPGRRRRKRTIVGPSWFLPVALRALVRTGCLLTWRPRGFRTLDYPTSVNCPRRARSATSARCAEPFTLRTHIFRHLSRQGRVLSKPRGHSSTGAKSSSPKPCKFALFLLDTRRSHWRNGRPVPRAIPEKRFAADRCRRRR